MTLVIPRGQTAQPEPRGGPSWDPAAAQLGLRSDDGPARAPRRPNTREARWQPRPSGFRVTSRFEQSIQPQSVTGAAGRHQGDRSVTGGG